MACARERSTHSSSNPGSRHGGYGVQCGVRVRRGAGEGCVERCSSYDGPAATSCSCQGGHWRRRACERQCECTARGGAEAVAGAEVRSLPIARPPTVSRPCPPQAPALSRYPAYHGRALRAPWRCTDAAAVARVSGDGGVCSGRCTARLEPSGACLPHHGLAGCREVPRRTGVTVGASGGETRAGISGASPSWTT